MTLFIVGFVIGWIGNGTAQWLKWRKLARLKSLTETELH